MERLPTQRAWQTLEPEQRVLIALPAQPSTDAIASGLGLASILKNMNKEPTVAAHDFRVPENHGFLQGHESIQTALHGGKQLVISVNTARAPVDELSYDVQGETLQIFLTPREGILVPENVSATSGNPNHTIIVTLDAPDLAALGPLFEEHTEFFYSTPIVNIDHHSGNTGYGHVNLVDLAATSTAEVVYALLSERKDAGIDAQTATHLLAGIIEKTKGFQAPTVSPRALTIASSLITKGARRDDILRHLFQSRPVTTLRLWGRVLARLQSEADGRILWSRIRREDFQKAGDDERALPGVLEELLHTAHRAEIVAVVYEQEGGGSEAVTAARPAVDLAHILGELEPIILHGVAYSEFQHMSLEQAEHALLSLALRAYGKSV